MSSRNKNFRRVRHAEDDDANGEETTTTTATPKPPRKLSFAGEEDESPFSSRRSSKSDRKKTPSSHTPKPPLSSSSSHKLTNKKDRISTPASSFTTLSSSSNVQPQSGEYTKEKLRELEKNTPTLSRSRPPPPPASEPVIILKGVIKPFSSVENKASTTNKRSEQEEDGHGGGDGEGFNDRKGGSGGSSFRRAKDDAETRLGSMGIGKSGEDDSSDSVILDQEAINAIRAKRERLRNSRAAAPDFISLDGGSNHGAAEGLSDEEPEFQGRIALFGDRKDGKKKGVFEGVDDVEMRVDSRKSVKVLVEDDEDEEDNIWEEEQFRKGLGKRMDDGSNLVSKSVAVSTQSVQQQAYAYPRSAYQMTPDVPTIGPLIGGAAGVTRSAEVMSISQLSEVACQAMQDNIRRLQESHGRTVSSMTRVEDNLSASLSNITVLEKSLSAAGEKFIFMQKLRDFVSVICDFLKHKAPFLEELEEQMQKLQEDRASAIVERRASDNIDETTEIEAGVSAAMSVFSKGGTSAAMLAAATAAAQAACDATKVQSNLPEKLDELGRDLNRQKRFDAARRTEARQRRKAKADSRRATLAGDGDRYHHVEGESSTDESDSESTSYRSNRHSLLQCAEQIFSDASEEYSQLSTVKERFEKWKNIYTPSYRDAYMSLSAPAIFSPYVRLELLKWDPLYEDMDFNDMEWHSLFFDYGLPENGAFNPDDADANLIPGLVEKIALPILHHQIAHCWDMLSTRETKNAVSATNLVITYVPASSEALRELLAIIHNRLADAIASLTVPTWTPLIIKAVPNAARIAAYRFGMSIRLLRNICLWKDILALPILEKLALDELLAGKILPHVRSVAANVHDAITRTERIVASLNGVWAGPAASGVRSQKLQALVEYVLALGYSLEKKYQSGVSENEVSGLARRLKKMLVELNEYDRARALAQKFHLKEAL